MNSKDFIKHNLSKIWNSFPEVQFRYEFKTHTNTHVIEVTPVSFFEENEEYLDLESDFEYKFEQMFPEEEILFISEGSLTEIRNAEFQIGGINVNFKNETFYFFSSFEGIDNKIDNSFNFALAA
ncbi:MAG: hypothetical protein GXX78_06670 [Bacteroidales bacterium]|nr:hypothetical protein [Bacteroidales bacterium]